MTMAMERGPGGPLFLYGDAIIVAEFPFSRLRHKALARSIILVCAIE
jgi:hypothetical protein